MTHIAHRLHDKERTCDIETDENVTFSDLLLSEPVLNGLHAAGFWRPSPIQLAAIPLGRCGLDLVIQAKSGTGKTCVLAVVALETVSVTSPATQAVVVAPTREVAVQVSQVVSTLASAMPGLSTAAFIGGTKLADDKAKLEGCQVVVGTPGRLNQLVSLGLLKARSVRLLILDEADRLLEGSFLAPVTELIKAFPHNKQVLCLSATFSDSAAVQAESLMRSPSHVRLDRESPALLGVNQVVCCLPSFPSPHKRQAAKEAELLRLLNQITFNQCLVFSGSQMRAESVCHLLQAKGWPAAHLTAAQSQTERLAALESLCSHKCRILVATDLAARGLDSAHVNLVVSLDLPPEPATYLHRAGRAGRFGSRGAAVMLVCGPEEWYGIRAIATLANVKLLLAGKEWVSHLTTKKVEGWRRRRTGTDKEEDVEAKDLQDGKKEQTEKQEEEKEETEKLEGRLEEGEEEKLSRLVEVDALCEEEARNWLKTHKPYKKKTVQAASQQNKEKPFKDKKERSLRGNTNGTESERQKDMNTQGPTNPETTKGNVKNQLHREEQNHGSESQKEEKENRGSEETNSFTHTYINGAKSQTEEEEGEQGDAGSEKAKDTEDLNTKATVMSLVNRLWEKHPPVTMSYPQLLSECTEKYKTFSATDDVRVKIPPWPVQVKATDKEMECLDRYVNRVQEEVKERERSWDGRSFDALAVLTALAERKDAGRVLEETTVKPSCTATEGNNDKIFDNTRPQVSSVTERKDAGKILEDTTEEASYMATERSDKKMLDDTRLQVSSVTERKDAGKALEETRPRASSVLSSHTTSTSPTTHSNVEESIYTTSSDHKHTPNSNKQSPQNPLSFPSNPKPSAETHIPSSPTYTQHTEHVSHSQAPHNTGTRPKERKQRGQQDKDIQNQSLYHQDQQESKQKGQRDKDIPNQSLYHQDQQDKDLPNQSLYHQDQQESKQKGQRNKDPPNQSLYHQDQQDKDILSRSLYHQDQQESKQKGHRNKDPPNQSLYHQDQQERRQRGASNTKHNQNYNPSSHTNEEPWGYNPWHPADESYQNTNSNVYDQNYDYNTTYPNYHQGYQDYTQGYATYDQGYGYHPYTQPASHIDAYIKSACKFASMMEYVTMMGRVSQQIAEDYHSRRKQWYEQAGDGTAARRQEQNSSRAKKGEQH